MKVFSESILIEFNNRSVYNVAKRALDILISLLSLTILFVPMVIVAVIIRLETRGGAIYKQERVANEGKTFTILKFRTMYDNAEVSGAKWADIDDCRVTRVGRLLRKTRFDETLQFINVLKGDMSIVGPRPEREIFHKQFCEEIDDWEKRLYVKQGITGLAQIFGGYNLSPKEKLNYDLTYIRNRSIGFDIWIIWNTIKIIFSHDGAR